MTYRRKQYLFVSVVNREDSHHRHYNDPHRYRTNSGDYLHGMKPLPLCKVTPGNRESKRPGRHAREGRTRLLRQKAIYII